MIVKLTDMGAENPIAVFSLGCSPSTLIDAFDDWRLTVKFFDTIFME